VVPAYRNNEGNLIPARHKARCESGLHGYALYLQGVAELDRINQQPAALAVIMGQTHIGLDVDRKNGRDGDARLQQLQKTLGELPCSFRETSKGGHGYHLIFSGKPADVANVRSTVDKWRGIDVRTGNSVMYQVPQELGGRSQILSDTFAEIPTQWLLALKAPGHEQPERASKAMLHAEKRILSHPVRDPNTLTPDWYVTAATWPIQLQEALARLEDHVKLRRPLVAMTTAEKPCAVAGEIALQYPYMQYNPPHLTKYVVINVNLHPRLLKSRQAQYGLPLPTFWIDKKHAGVQLVYELDGLWSGKGYNQVRGLTTLLKAAWGSDINQTVLNASPVNAGWATYVSLSSGNTFHLPELRQMLLAILAQNAIPRKVGKGNTTSRNSHGFDHLRFLGYALTLAGCSQEALHIKLEAEMLAARQEIIAKHPGKNHDYGIAEGMATVRSIVTYCFSHDHAYLKKLLGGESNRTGKRKYQKEHRLLRIAFGYLVTGKKSVAEKTAGIKKRNNKGLIYDIPTQKSSETWALLRNNTRLISVATKTLKATLGVTSRGIEVSFEYLKKPKLSHSNLLFIYPAGEAGETLTQWCARVRNNDKNSLGMTVSMNDSLSNHSECIINHTEVI
jgi:hypothetical protein